MTPAASRACTVITPPFGDGAPRAARPEGARPIHSLAASSLLQFSLRLCSCLFNVLVAPPSLAHQFSSAKGRKHPHQPAAEPEFITRMVGHLPGTLLVFPRRLWFWCFSCGFLERRGSCQRDWSPGSCPLTHSCRKHDLIHFLSVELLSYQLCRQKGIPLINYIALLPSPDSSQSFNV